MLNERYIEAYLKALQAARNATNVEEAKAIEGKIATLRAEVDRLKNPSSNSLETDAGIPGEHDPLIGKTLSFPHPNNPDLRALIEFHSGGKAFWLGSGNQRVDRRYKLGDKPNEYLVWWPERSDRMEYRITVDKDAKVANVVVSRNGKESLGTFSQTE